MPSAARTISMVIFTLFLFVLLPVGIWKLVVDGEIASERWWNPFLFETWFMSYAALVANLGDEEYSSLSRSRRFAFWCKVFVFGVSSLVFYMFALPFKLVGRGYVEMRQVAAKVDFGTKGDAKNPNYQPIGTAPERPKRSDSRPPSVNISLPAIGADNKVTHTQRFEVAFVDDRSVSKEDDNESDDDTERGAQD